MARPRRLRGGERRSAVALVVAGLAVGLPVAAVAGHGGQGEEAVSGEVLSLDAVADGEQIDLLMALRDEPSPRLVHRRSTDGGITWGDEHQVDLGGRPMHAPHRGMDPQIAASGDRLLAVWTGSGTSEWGSGPMATSVSADGGLTWMPGPTPADDGRTDGHNYIDAVADADGTFHVVWLDNREGGRGLTASSSTDGRTWSPSRNIDDRTCECCWNRLYAAPDGGLAVLYRDKLPTDLRVATSAGSDAAWRRLGPAGDFGWQFDGCPHVGGALAWLDSDASRSGVAAVAAGARAGEGDDGMVDGDGSVGRHASLHAVSWTGAEGRAGLWAVASDDGGTTWSEPRRLGSDRARHSDLAAAGDRLVAVWDESYRIHASWSSDRGATWSAPEPLSDPELRATHPLVLSTGEAAVALWTEKSEWGGWSWVARRLGP